MTAAADSILPVFLLIVLGWSLRVVEFPGDGFWSPAERLCYFLLFPSLLITTLANADFGRFALAPMAVAIVASILLVTLLLVVAQRLVRLDGAAFSSVYQGAVRMNTYIGLSIAAGVHGAVGLEAAALAIAVIVPLVNVTCVCVMAYYAEHEPPSAAMVAGQVARNPLIIGCAIGGLLNVTGLGVPPLLGPMAEILARAALPLGLLAVGAALDFSAARRSGYLTLQVSAIKLVALPLVTYAFARALGVDGVSAFVAVIFNALPTASSAYVLARHMGGDTQLMAALIAVETLLSALTLPLWLALVV